MNDIKKKKEYLVREIVGDYINRIELLRIR